jgi:hypothetical protein
LCVVLDHPAAAHSVVDETVGCDPVGSLESAREVKGIREADPLGDLLDHQTVVEEELRGVVHFEAHQELVCSNPSESPKQSRDVHRREVALFGHLFDGA